MARNQDLNQKMRDQRKEQILSNALALFATRGLSATKISDIASASGVSQGLIYHYFRSKEEVFVELVRTAFERLNNACRELEKLPLSPREKIRRATEGLLHNIEESKDASRYYLVITQATASEAIPEEAKAIIDGERMLPYEVMKHIIEEGQADGSIGNHDASDLSLVFWTSIKGLAIHRAVHGTKFKMPDPEIIMSMFV